jgi:mannose-6-phosphate isomerase-like protein (cupin superfamily)
MNEERSEIKLVSKSWGFEKIIHNEKYCGKILFIVKNHSTSLHYHQIKDETFYIQSGKVLVYYSDNLSKIKELTGLEQDGSINPEVYQNLSKITLNVGDSFRIPPKRVHQIIAIEDTELLEFSTKHFDGDSHRLINGG